MKGSMPFEPAAMILSYSSGPTRSLPTTMSVPSTSPNAFSALLATEPDSITTRTTALPRYTPSNTFRTSYCDRRSAAASSASLVKIHVFGLTALPHSFARRCPFVRGDLPSVPPGRQVDRRSRTSTSGGPHYSLRATQCGRAASRRRTPRRFGTNSKSVPSRSCAVQNARTTRSSSARNVLTARGFNDGSSAGSVATKAAQ